MRSNLPIASVRRRNCARLFDYRQHMAFAESERGLDFLVHKPRWRQLDRILGTSFRELWCSGLGVYSAASAYDAH